MPLSYAALTPDVVLDACDSAGFRADGRLLPLNSYENRVYQVWLEDGGSVVLKFYRAARLAARACIDPGRSAGRVESGDRTGPRQRGAMLRARRRGALDPAARRLPRGKHPVDRERSALRRSRRRAHGSGAAGSLDAALGRAARDDAAALRPACGLRGLHAFRAARAAPARGAAHAAADALLRVARAPLGRSGLSRRISLVRHAALLAGPDPRAARADRRDGRRTAQRVTNRFSMNTLSRSGRYSPKGAHSA